jgi:hypothetical protein
VLDGTNATCDENLDGLLHQDHRDVQSFLSDPVQFHKADARRRQASETLSRPTILKGERVILAVCSFTVDVAIRWQGIYWSRRNVHRRLTAKSLPTMPLRNAPQDQMLVIVCPPGRCCHFLASQRRSPVLLLFRVSAKVKGSGTVKCIHNCEILQPQSRTAVASRCKTVQRAARSLLDNGMDSTYP